MISCYPDMGDAVPAPTYSRCYKAHYESDTSICHNGYNRVNHREEAPGPATRRTRHTIEPMTPDSDMLPIGAVPSDDTDAVIRATLVGWIAEVATSLALSPAVLAASVAHVDALLTAPQVPRPPESLLQLLALTCLKLAVREETDDEGYGSAAGPPLEWSHLARDAASGQPLYQAIDFDRMEALVLETTGRLGLPTIPSRLPPTPHSLLQRLLHCMETGPWVTQQCGVTAPNNEDGAMNGQLRAVADLLAELALPVAPLQRHPPATLAAASFLLAASIVNQSDTQRNTPGPVSAGFTDASVSQGGWNLTSQFLDSSPTHVASLASPFMSGAVSVPCTSTVLPVDQLSSEALPQQQSSGQQPADPMATGMSSATVPTLAAALGLDEHILAPGLQECLKELRHQYESTLWWFMRYGGINAVADAYRWPAVVMHSGDEDAAPGWLAPSILQRHLPLLACLVHTLPTGEYGW